MQFEDTFYDAQWYFQKDSVHGFPTPNSTFGSVPVTPGETVPSVNVNKDFGDELTIGNTTANVGANVTLKGMDRQFSVYASALANVSPGNFPDQVFIQAEGDLSLHDTLTLFVPNPNNDLLKVTSYWYIHGNVSSQADGHYSSATPPVALDYVNANSQAALTIWGAGVPDSQYGHFWGESAKSIDSNVTVPINVQHDPATVLPITLFFENEVPQPFNLNITASATAVVEDKDYLNARGGYAQAVVDMGHTFTWGGITSVTDAVTGQPIDNWTLTSASGTDWAHAAPEPSSFILAAFGLAGLAAWGWRRRSLSR